MRGLNSHSRLYLHRMVVLVTMLWVMIFQGPHLHRQQVSQIDKERFSISVRVKDGLKYFADTTGQLTIQEVWEADSLFEQGPKASEDPFGIYWVKMSLLNTTPYDLDVVATGPRTINTYLYKREGDGFFTARYGSFTKKRDINPGDSRTHAFF